MEERVNWVPDSLTSIWYWTVSGWGRSNEKTLTSSLVLTTVCSPRAGSRSSWLIFTRSFMPLQTEPCCSSMRKLSTLCSVTFGTPGWNASNWRPAWSGEDREALIFHRDSIQHALGKSDFRDFIIREGEGCPLVAKDLWNVEKKIRRRQSN